jgi:2-methylcitrate dehydratase
MIYASSTHDIIRERTMDQTTRTLASYIAKLSSEDLSASALHETKRRFVDAIGCGIGGYSSEPAAIARSIAADASGSPAARVLGSAALTSMEMAAFVNTVTVRFLDCNDTYISKGSGHPSDMIGACLAVADAHRRTGLDTLLAIAASYEVFTALADVIPLRDLGWDQGVFVVLGSAAGASKLLRLNAEQTAHALAIAITANIATRQTRAGELSMWKGCATAAATRAGVFAALLASKGMTGPSAAFEGRHGVWEQVTGKFEIGALGGDGTAFGIERTNLKFFPSEYHSQAPLWIALELRNKLRVEDIESIDVQTYYTAYSEIGSEPEKWNPLTRETADHSLPYLLARGLIDGYISTESFSEARMRDQSVRDLMGRIRISENQEFTREFPSKLITRIEVATRSGERYVETAAYPKGHARNPMSDADVEAKFIGLTRDLLTPEAASGLVQRLWQIDRENDVSALLAQIRV